MLKYPSDPEKLKEVKSIELSLKFLFTTGKEYTPMDLLIARNLTEKYKKLMDWNNQIMSGPIYQTE
jgi:hypothetical protein